MRRIYEDDHVEIDHDEANAVLWIARTSVPYGGADDFASDTAGLKKRLMPLEPRAIVLDVRRVRGRHDDDFEGVVKRLQVTLLDFVERLVILTASAVGALQAKRLSKADGERMLVTQDEDEARAFVQPRTRRKMKC